MAKKSFCYFRKNVTKVLLSSVLISSNFALISCQNIGLGEMINEGYVYDEHDIMAVKQGSSLKEVILALGSPTVQTNHNGKTYYYISQKRYKAAEFMEGKIIDRKILALYFDKNNRVKRVANYGLRDGNIIDFISNTTPSVYQEDEDFLSKILQSTKMMPSGLPTNSH